MAHEWHAGVLTQSSWHGLEAVEELPDAETMIRRGRETHAWPTEVVLETMTTSSDVVVPGAAVVATYESGTRVCHSAMGTKYTPLDPKEWNASIEAAVKAGAKPAGAFALRGGRQILATFEVPSADGAGIRNMLNMADSMDGSMAHIIGGSSIRVVCANTLAAWMGQGEKKAARILHFGTINERVDVLREAIAGHITSGAEMVTTYERARQTHLSKEAVDRMLGKLFPLPTEETSKRTSTRMVKARSDVFRAMNLRENNEDRPGELNTIALATVWNAATWLVDRDVNGKAVPTRTDRLSAMLFGSRAKRVAEIRSVVSEELALAA